MSGINLEVGKTYCTREGDAHFKIMKRNSEGSSWDSRYEFIGKCVKDGSSYKAGEKSAFMSNGSFWINQVEDELDLAKEVVNVHSPEFLVSNEPLASSVVNHLLSNYTLDELKQYAYDRMMDEYLELSEHQLRQLHKQLGVPSE